ncbi:hypothetical protein SAMN05421846_10372 [Chryseobacterium taeanense]|uniref:Histidine kinase N-terminal 7TM region domain-containing protein n=1 Tax=Chryseobacterium taeanense TaxID=311334 RepID=A0A1G8GR13_9FLAO|nr:hypothetical protein [Chryseobacterium taeanense]SDH96806.1 hypothetical protein SAMN05421846_10372 [Chryseobacterium taeanense]
MGDFQRIVQELMFWSEGFAALISILYYQRIKNEYWKFFVFYLVFAFVSESIGKWGDHFIEYNKQAFYNYFVIPVEFLFFYWLYAAKSFNKPKLFFILSFIYLLSFIPGEFFYPPNKVMFSLNYTLGCLILMILVIMEYYKQINSSNILDFGKNRMFYINLGVTLFYIGTLPFWTFFELLKSYREIYNIYFAYFLISGVVMYVLFSISFLWGKQNS